MANIKDYIWVFPLVGGILTIVGLLTPVAYLEALGIGEYYWLWGLRYLDAGPYGTFTNWFFELEPKEFTPFLFLDFFVHFVIFLIVALVILISALKARKEGDIHRFQKIWLSLGIILIIVGIVYLIDTEIIMDYYYDKYFGMSGESFWRNYDPGFAIIAPFLSGSLTITGVAVFKYVSKREDVIPFKEKILPIGEPSITEEPKGFHFCPECGAKIMYRKSKFCTNCGYEFINV